MTARDKILVAFRLSHTGHNGMPGSPDSSCPRCNAERELDDLVADNERLREKVRLFEVAGRKYVRDDWQAWNNQDGSAWPELRAALAAASEGATDD